MTFDPMSPVQRDCLSLAPCSPPRPDGASVREVKGLGADAVRVEIMDCPGSSGDEVRLHEGPPSNELCVVQRGSFHYTSARAEVLVDPMTSLFGLVGEESEITHPVPGGDRDALIFFSDSVLAAVAGDVLDLPTAVPTSPWAAYAERQLAVLAAAGERGADATELAVSVVASTIAQEQPRRVDSGRPATKRAARSLFDDARTILLERPDVSILALAAEIGCSPFHLSRVFGRFTGRGVGAYRSSLRVACALDQLADGQGNLADVAAVAGFADHAHLSRTIRARFGSTPSALRTALSQPTSTTDFNHSDD